MTEAAENLEFERAAALRDRLNAMKIVYEDQKVVGIGQEDMDVIACEKGSDEAWIDVFFIRRGSMVGRDNFIMAGTYDDTDSHIIAKFIEQFYIAGNPHMPRRLLTQTEPEDAHVLQELLTENRGAKMEINVPKRGPKRKLVDMAHENAVQGLSQLKLKWQSNSDLMGRALDDLQEALSLPNRPYRIECYDISHIQGTSSVAAMSVFENGAPATSQYRRFKINTVDGNDDFASMREVLTRRFKRLNAAREKAVEGTDPTKPSDSFGITPDLVLIDGGKGQLSSAVSTMLHLGVADIPLASIAKKEEELFTPRQLRSDPTAPQRTISVRTATGSGRGPSLRDHVSPENAGADVVEVSVRPRTGYRSVPQTCTYASFWELESDSRGKSSSSSHRPRG